LPFDGDGARNLADVEQLGFRAHVDELGAALHEGVRFGRQQRAGIT